MAILVTCECGKQFQTGDDYAGRKARCPECGRELIIPQAGANPYASPKANFPGDPEFAGPGSFEPKTSGKAITSLVLGVISPFCTLFTGIPAIIFGALGLGEINRSQGRLTGKGMATTGIVLGAISCSLIPIMILIALLLPAVQAGREAGRRTQCANNLRQIGLALFNYETSYGQFPPAAINDPNGKPLLSWRVAILPFIESQALYNKFKLDEPWDSPHNQALLAEIPNAYRCPSDPTTAAPTSTRYQGPTGPGAIFEGPEGTTIRTITDGTSNTIIVAEAANSVPWTKPDDLPGDPTQPNLGFGSMHPGGFNAVMADGSVRFLKTSINPQVFQSLITKNGSEVITNDAF